MRAQMRIFSTCIPKMGSVRRLFLLDLPIFGFHVKLRKRLSVAGKNMHHWNLTVDSFHAHHIHVPFSYFSENSGIFDTETPGTLRPACFSAQVCEFCISSRMQGARATHGWFCTVPCSSTCQVMVVGFLDERPPSSSLLPSFLLLLPPRRTSLATS